MTRGTARHSMPVSHPALHIEICSARRCRAQTSECTATFHLVCGHQRDMLKEGGGRSSLPALQDGGQEGALGSCSWGG